MGVIEEGTVSGCLPSATVFAVHYPGYPSSISRAIDTLGGVDSIEKVRTLESNKLELRFRPEDPHSNPASGQLYPCNNFLLKISRKSRNNCLHVDSNNQIKSADADIRRINPEFFENEMIKIDSASGSSKLVADEVPDNMPNHISADIVAQVEEAYHFNGMADYQHVLAVHADVACKRKRTWTDVETSNETGAPADVDENLMILAPPLFSPKDIPENLVLRPSATLSSKKKLEGVVHHRWEMEIEPCLAIDFNIKDILLTCASFTILLSSFRFMRCSILT